LLCNAYFANDSLPGFPSEYYDLANWKLQIPGPREIKNLTDYSSGYFYLAADTAICFELNAAEKGATKNSHYVRSELRHVINWAASSKHFLSATIKVSADLPSYQVTVMQIHGITKENENAPPLLRIAVVNNDLYAYLKSDSTGTKTEKHLLLSNVSSQYFSAVIKIENAVLSIVINGKEYLRKELGYWKYMNYFKLGCYPQQQEGNFKVFVKGISVL
jgi:hypothetical protein